VHPFEKPASRASPRRPRVDIGETLEKQPKEGKLSLLNFVASLRRHYRKKRLDAWKRPINEAENHMHRAAHLADDKVAEMSYLIGPSDEDTPDWNLYFAAALSIGRSLGHLRARYKSVAFDQFYTAELSEPDPIRTATRWLERAGLPDQQPIL